jgi:hypothetical protein
METTCARVIFVPMQQRAIFNKADFDLGPWSYTFYEDYCTEVERKPQYAKTKKRYLRSSYFARLRITLILLVLWKKVAA